ncbi:MAG: Uma2 family endonuclease [Acidobacteriaceae bacterium]|nr:Uma2 family endonuclease [Acidobacteriaceae bacterium]
MSTQPNHLLSVEEYLRFEATSEVRHEYFRGEVFAMAGGTPSHARILVNLIREFGIGLRGCACEIFGSGLGVKLPSGLYTYPDASISCSPQFEGNFLLNPLVLFEILSESTEAYDRGKKFQQYRELSSLQTYVLIAQDSLYVEQYKRGQGGWTMQDLTALAHKLILDLPSGELVSVDLSLLYEGVLTDSPS